MSLEFDPGCVRLRLACNHGRVTAVHISSERPDVTGVLRGRTADQAVQLLPLLFALCGQAQAQAAVLALSAARGQKCEPHIDVNVQREMLREHLWRCLLDLPPLLGTDPLQQEFVSAARLLAAGQRGELHTLLTAPLIDTLRRRLNRMNDPPFSSRPLPALDASKSLSAWPRFTAEFCRRPDWVGQAAETGAWARQTRTDKKVTSPFATRWLARFDELLDWASSNEQVGAGGSVSAAPVAPHIGRSLVETARGLLMHEIVLDGERIADYLIVAPTEWNFHPQGILARHLLGQNAEDRDALQQHVVRAVAALDPCVPWTLEWA